MVERLLNAGVAGFLSSVQEINQAAYDALTIATRDGDLLSEDSWAERQELYRHCLRLHSFLAVGMDLMYQLRRKGQS